MAHLGKTYDLDQQCFFVPFGLGHIDGSCDGDGDSSGGEPFPVEVPVHQNPKPGRVYQCHNPDQRQITTYVCVCVLYYLYYVSDCAYRCKVLVWSSRRVIIVEGRGLEKDFFLFLSGRFSITLSPS